jgi:hypothetical protein
LPPVFISFIFRNRNQPFFTMKRLFALLLLSFAAIYTQAQVKLSDKDFNNLVALAQLYTQNNMCKGEQFAQSANALRTPLLNNMVDALIETGKADTTLLQKRFLSRPSHDELVLWYVIREIHYNRVDTSRKQKPDIEVANEVLAQNIDERWLLDNYYYRIISGVAMLFNTADLSHYNFITSDLGFKDDTESAIFFFNIMAGLANSRFTVLQYLKKPEKLSEFNHRMPHFNGKPYFAYTNFDIADFEWIGYDKKESYKKRNIGDFMNSLMIQFTNSASMGNKADARELYFNSILSKPEYFSYSAFQDVLQQFYNKSKR